MKKSNSLLVLNNSENFLEKINFNDNNKKEFFEYVYSRLKHKIFLEKILHIIKITQIEFLSQISAHKKNNKFSYKIIKNILQELKNELDSTFKDNIQNKTNIESTTNKNKSDLIKNIFGKVKKDNNLKIKNNKNQIINYKYSVELPNLKLLNFKIENQLTYMDIKIKLLSPNLFNNKDTFKYVYLFLDSKNDTTQAYNFLHDNLIYIREAFKLIVKNKELQNNRLLQMNAAVNILKEECHLIKKNFQNEYINTSQIINEESKEYITKTGVCTNEIYNNNNNKINEYESDNIYKNKLVRVNGNNND
jgi:hypothetical protein